MPQRIVMIGAGSPYFSLAIVKDLVQSELLRESTFVLMDIDGKRLSASEERIRRFVRELESPLKIESTTDRRAALSGASFIVTSYAPERIDFWMKDIQIARRHGVDLLLGENGGPAGQIHALRNITIMMGIVRDMEKLCPDAWLMNFTNPMSMMCTYLYKHTPVKAQGFCHQVHGSFGVIAEMLGMEPGDLRPISAGINHMNFLLDIKRRDNGESFMEEFLDKVRRSPYWQENYENVPEQIFTLEFLNTFGIYPVGYDNHICEYLPFFYSPEEWRQSNYHNMYEGLLKLKGSSGNPSCSAGTLLDTEVGTATSDKLIPFPKDPDNPYYKENPVPVMEALITGEPLYLDAMILLNNGCITNLPSDAVVEIPAVVVGGKARGIAVGDLPFFPAELCRRQIATHELVVLAAINGDRRMFLEALCLDPYVHSLGTARRLMEDYLNEYRGYVPQFF